MVGYIKYKEKGSDHIGTTSYSSPYELTREFLIDFFGLNRPDVTWFSITIE